MRLNIKTVFIFVAWVGVLLFAITISTIRRRLNQGQTSESPLDLTRTKKEKRNEVAKELLLMKVKETTTVGPLLHLLHLIRYQSQMRFSYLFIH